MIISRYNSPKNNRGSVSAGVVGNGNSSPTQQQFQLNRLIWGNIDTGQEIDGPISVGKIELGYPDALSEKQNLAQLIKSMDDRLSEVESSDSPLAPGEERIPYNNLAGKLAELAMTRYVSGKHIFQISYGSRNLGLLLISGDNASDTLNLLLVTRCKVDGPDILTGTNSDVGLYTNIYRVSNAAFGNWKAVGGGGAGDLGDINGRISALFRFLNHDEDDGNISSDYGGNNLRQILANINSYIGKDGYGKTMPFNGESLKQWLIALMYWTGLPSADPGDWDKTLFRYVSEGDFFMKAPVYEYNTQDWNSAYFPVYNEDNGSMERFLLEDIRDYVLHEFGTITVDSFDDLYQRVRFNVGKYMAPRPLRVGNQLLGTLKIIQRGNKVLAFVETFYEIRYQDLPPYEMDNKKLLYTFCRDLAESQSQWILVNTTELFDIL